MITGDSLGQVASQTLRNLVAVEAAARMPVFRPLIGTDKMDIIATGAQNRNLRYFFRAVSRLLPGVHAAHAGALCDAADLDEAESKLDVPALIEQGVRETTLERFHYRGGQVETVAPEPARRKPDRNAPRSRNLPRSRAHKSPALARCARFLFFN